MIIPLQYMRVLIIKESLLLQTEGHAGPLSSMIIDGEIRVAISFCIVKQLLERTIKSNGAGIGGNGDQNWEDRVSRITYVCD